MLLQKIVNTKKIDWFLLSIIKVGQSMKVLEESVKFKS